MKFNFDNIVIPKKIDSPISKAVMEILFESSCSSEALYVFLEKLILQLPQLNFGRKIEKQPVMMFPKKQRETDEDLKFQPYYSISTSDKQYSFALGPHALFFILNKNYEGWSVWAKFFMPILAAIKKENIIEAVVTIGDSCLDDIHFDDVIVMEQLNCDFRFNDKSISSGFSFASHVTDKECEGDFLIHSADDHTAQINIACTTKKNWSANDFFSKSEQILQIPHQMNKKIFFSLLKKEFISSHFSPEW